MIRIELACEGGTNLCEANLVGARLWNANTKGAILCKTKTPWGVANSGFQK